MSDAHRDRFRSCRIPSDGSGQGLAGSALKCDAVKSHSFVASRTRVAGLALIVYMKFSTSSERHT